MYDQNLITHMIYKLLLERNDVTRTNAVSERKKSVRKIDLFSFAV